MDRKGNVSYWYLSYPLSAWWMRRLRVLREAVDPFSSDPWHDLTLQKSVCVGSVSARPLLWYGESTEEHRLVQLRSSRSTGAGLQRGLTTRPDANHKYGNCLVSITIFIWWNGFDNSVLLFTNLPPPKIAKKKKSFSLWHHSPMRYWLMVRSQFSFFFCFFFLF